MTTTINASTSAGLVNTADTSGVLQLQTANTTAVTIDTSQNVGIGATPSSTLASYKSLDIGASGSQISATSGVVNIAANALRNTSWTYAGTNYATLYQQDAASGIHTWYTAPSGSGTISWSERMRIDSAGNLGIGTTAPRSLLDVVSGSANTAGDAVGALTVTGAAPNYGVAGYGTLTVQSNDAMAIDKGGGIAFGTRTATASTAGVQVAGITGAKENGTSGNTAGYLGFYTRTNGAGISERMRIDSSGNLLVAGTSYTYGKVTSGGSINPVSSNWANNASFAAYGSYGGGILVIDTGSGTPKGYGLWAQNNGSDFYIKGNLVGSTPTGGVYLANNGTSWSSASDENVKDIIEPITNAVEKVSTLRTVIGKYKYEEDGVRHPFLIAQDIQKVLPEAISTMNKGEDDECLGLSYTDTIPLLVAAIKEQAQIINDLKARITALEGAK